MEQEEKRVSGRNLSRLTSLIKQWVIELLEENNLLTKQVTDSLYDKAISLEDANNLLIEATEELQNETKKIDDSVIELNQNIAEGTLQIGYGGGTTTLGDVAEKTIPPNGFTDILWGRESDDGLSIDVATKTIADGNSSNKQIMTKSATDQKFEAVNSTFEAVNTQIESAKNIANQAKDATSLENLRTTLGNVFAKKSIEDNTKGKYFEVEDNVDYSEYKTQKGAKSYLDLSKFPSNNIKFKSAQSVMIPNGGSVKNYQDGETYNIINASNANITFVLSSDDVTISGASTLSSKNKCLITIETPLSENVCSQYGNVTITNAGTVTGC